VTFIPPTRLPPRDRSQATDSPLTPRPSPYFKGPPGPWQRNLYKTARTAAAIDSLGTTALIAAARRQSRNQISSSPTTEGHMNPISALVFLVFIGGAVVTRLLDMPIWLTSVLAVIGVFLGYSIMMAQQWERAVILRLG